MKIAFSNGWKLAPHCWKYFLTHPIWYESNKAFTTISIIGFVFYVYSDEKWPTVKDGK